MRAFVTGSTGLLGNNLVRELVARGHSVRALARSRAKAERLLGGTGAEIVTGDMADVAAFGGRLEGCDVLFHTAAYFREYYQPGDHWPELERINVAATLELVAAAHRRGVGRTVDTSSSGVIGAKPDGSPGDETTPPGPAARRNLYMRSKVVVYERLREFTARTGFPVVTVLPGWMFGPYDAAPTGSGQVVLDFLARKLPAIPPGGTSIVDARDVAAGMVAAAERGVPGERYIVGGAPLTLGDVFRALERVTGLPAPRLRVPYPVALGVAYAAQTYARLSGRPSAMSVEGVRTMASSTFVSSERARRELGVTFRSIDETLRDEVAWLREAGMATADAVPARALPA